MSNTGLPSLKQKELLKHFKNLENNVIGEGKYEEVHTLLEKFRNKYLQ